MTHRCESALTRVQSLEQMGQLLAQGLEIRVWSDSKMLGKVIWVDGNSMRCQESRGMELEIHVLDEHEFFNNNGVAVFAKRAVEFPPGSLQPAFDSAEEVMSTWPEWKRGSLIASTQSTRQTPREPVVNEST